MSGRADPAIALDLLARGDITVKGRMPRSSNATFLVELALDGATALAHLAARRSVYQFPRVLDAEYVLVDAYGDIPKGDLQSGYDDCLRGLDRLGFDAIRSEDGLTLWRKNRPAVTAPDVSVACSGQHAEVGRAP